MKPKKEKPAPLAIRTALLALEAIETEGLIEEPARDLHFVGKVYYVTGGLKGMKKARRRILDLGPRRARRRAIIDVSWSGFTPKWRVKAKRDGRRKRALAWLDAKRAALLGAPGEIVGG